MRDLDYLSSIIYGESGARLFERTFDPEKDTTYSENDTSDSENDTSDSENDTSGSEIMLQILWMKATKVLNLWTVKVLKILILKI